MAGVGPRVPLSVGGRGLEVKWPAVGVAAALYRPRKSLHDRHLSQSILTGVFPEEGARKEEEIISQP